MAISHWKYFFLLFLRSFFLCSHYYKKIMGHKIGQRRLHISRICEGDHFFYESNNILCVYFINLKCFTHFVMLASEFASFGLCVFPLTGLKVCAVFRWMKIMPYLSLWTKHQANCQDLLRTDVHMCFSD